MPVISCTSCKSRFKVGIDTIGKAIRCPRCKEEFKAIALKAGTQKKDKNAPIIYASIGVGSILVALLIHSIATSGQPDPNEAVAETRPEKPITKKAPTDTFDESSLSPEDLLARRAKKILEAIRDPDNPLLPGWIAYQAMHEQRKSDGLEQQSWTEMSADESYGKREEYLDLVLGDDALRRFSRASTVVSTEVLRLGSGKGKVQARIKNNVDETVQDVLLTFAGMGGQWKLASIERSEISTAEAIAEAAERESRRGGGSDTLDRISRRRNPLGTVAEVDPYADTSTSVTSEIQRQLRELTDLGATVKASQARRKLVEIGKASVPHLINTLVPLDLDNPSDAQVATRATQALVELTGQDWPIVPGMNEGSLVGEGAGDNETNRKMWFGWWRDHKDTYNGPPAADFGEGNEGGEAGR